MLGGGVVEAGDLLIDAARATFAELVEGGDRRPLAASCPPPSASGPVRSARRWRRARGALVMRTGIVLPTFRDTPDDGVRRRS